MNPNVDFATIAFNAVKRNTSKGHAPDFIDSIMDDYVAGGDFQNSFNTIADEIGAFETSLIFGEFVSSDALCGYVGAYNGARHAAKFAAELAAKKAAKKAATA